MTDSRKTALLILEQCEKDKSFIDHALHNELIKSQMDVKDKALTSELVYGVIEKQLTLDFFIDELSNIPINKLQSKVLNIIRMALYQIIYLDRIPDSAACNEAVILSKKFAGLKASGFVNGILRNFLRKKDELLSKLNNKPLHIRYSVSKDISDMLIEQYGAEKCEEILKAFNIKRPLSISVNTLKVKPEVLSVKLQGNIVNDDMIEVSPSGDVRGLYGYKDGYFFVQDRSSAKAVKMLSPKPGETVIDMCSSPGGKTFKAAILMNNEGKIFSFDISEKKKKLIEEGKSRLGLSIIETGVKNGREFDPIFFEKADKIICDVPCSGIGVITKKPDIRYKTKNDIEGLLNVQKDILKVASCYLKPGGDLLYSTCTLNKSENEGIIDSFLNEHLGFTLVFMQTILPDKDHDGFFISILRKKQGE